MKTLFAKKHLKSPKTKLARSITWTGSKQTYYTARLLVDRDLVDDCYRAYAYFRWADDFIDISSRSKEERIAFIERQERLIDRCYQGEHPQNLTQEERMIADLIRHDSGGNGGLKSFIDNFLAILAFDAHRRGRAITQQELTWYSHSLAKAVTDGIQYFIGHHHAYPSTESRYKAVIAAHITHMLRDLLQDIRDGFINIPEEYLTRHAIDLEQLDSPFVHAWVRDRVVLARKTLHEGKRYLDSLGVLRCKIAGFWYCARYEWVLDAITRDGYRLREVYQPSLFVVFKMIWSGMAVTFRHYFHRGLSVFLSLKAQGREIDELHSKTKIARQ